MPQRQRADDDDQEEILELTPDMEADEPPEDDQEGEEDEEGAAEPGEGDQDAEGEEDGEPFVGFADDDQAQDDDNSVIKRIRERNRELARENAELRRAQPVAQQIELGPKPTLQDCDFDEDKFEVALDAWKDRKAAIDKATADQTAAQEQISREWQSDLNRYAAARDALAMPDYEETIDPVKATLSLAQQAVIVKAASDPAAFSYALGRSDARLAELAKIQDPIKLAAVIARMEGGLKVTRKRKAPQPDRPAKGTARLPGSPDKQLEKLEAEAERTGDRTQIIAYKKKLAARSKAK